MTRWNPSCNGITLCLFGYIPPWCVFNLSWSQESRSSNTANITNITEHRLSLETPTGEAANAAHPYCYYGVPFSPSNDRYPLTTRSLPRREDEQHWLTPAPRIKATPAVATFQLVGFTPCSPGASGPKPYVARAVASSTVSACRMTWYISFCSMVPSTK
jgi:hypothetical protein